MSGDIFVVWLLASTRQRPGRLLNVLQHTDSPHNNGSYRPKSHWHCCKNNINHQRMAVLMPKKKASESKQKTKNKKNFWKVPGLDESPPRLKWENRENQEEKGIGKL